MGRKSKFTLKKRVSMCKDYLEMGLSHKDILIKYGVSNRVFYRYINRFRIHGIEGLKEVGPRNREYTREFKTKVINFKFYLQFFNICSKIIFEYSLFII